MTNNIRTIHSVPLELGSPLNIEVRGEVIMSKDVWKKLNKQQEKEEKPLYANTRNAAAGSIRQFDPKITSSRRLDYYAYDIVTDLGFKTHQEIHAKLKDLGFKTSKFERRCKSLDEVMEFYQEINNQRDKLPFGIDGIVVLVNELATFRRLGVVGKAPRGMGAFKFSPQQTPPIL